MPEFIRVDNNETMTQKEIIEYLDFSYDTVYDNSIQ